VSNPDFRRAGEYHAPPPDGRAVGIGCLFLIGLVVLMLIFVLGRHQSTDSNAQDTAVPALTSTPEPTSSSPEDYAFPVGTCLHWDDSSQEASQVDCTASGSENYRIIGIVHGVKHAGIALNLDDPMKSSLDKMLRSELGAPAPPSSPDQTDSYSSDCKDYPDTTKVIWRGPFSIGASVVGDVMCVVPLRAPSAATPSPSP
jgi:hypothetical protein